MKKRILVVFCIFLLILPVGSLAVGPPTLLWLTVNGTPVTGFDPDTYSYNVTVPNSSATVTVAFEWDPNWPDMFFEGSIYVGGGFVSSSNDPSGAYTFTAAVGPNDILTLSGTNNMPSMTRYSLRITRKDVPPTPHNLGDSAEPAPYVPQGEPAKIGNCKEYAPVYERADKKSAVIGKAILGEAILLQRWNSGETWCRVLYNNGNNIGWVQGKFIIPQK